MGPRSRSSAPGSRWAPLLAALLALAPASVAAAQEPEPGLPFGLGDPLALEREQVPAIDQPESWRLPVFNAYFGESLAPASSQHESVAVGKAPDGTGRVFVATAAGDRVVVFNSDTLAQVGIFGWGHLVEPAGIAYYRGEVYVLDRAQQPTVASRVVVYGTDGTHRREFELPRGLELSGLDVAWGQVWMAVQGCGGFAGGVLVVDAQTGAVEHLVAQPSHQPTGKPTSPCDERADPSGWWDIALVPELDVGIAGFRMVDRGRVPGFLTPDPEVGCTTCPVKPYGEGGDAVWGMRWFLTVDGDSETARGTGVTEYSLDPNPTTGHPQLVRQREWRPQQANTGKVRDVAYLSREDQIKWSGPLTGDAWLRGSHCADYVVSDADIFVAGARIEHWVDQSAAFQRAEFSVDGVILETKLTPAGSFCLDTTTLSSGTHTVTVRAKLGSRWLTVGNEQLRVDNTAPDGSVTAPPAVVTGSRTVNGTLTDAHSGPGSWQLEAQGGEPWQSACAPDTSSPYSCLWATDARTPAGDPKFPDGRHLLRAQLRDAVDVKNGGPNSGVTATVETIVDNNPPQVNASGPAKPLPGSGPLPDGRHRVTVNATDGEGSGVRKLEFLVDGKEIDEVTQSCPAGGCDLVHDFLLRTDPLAEGAHTLSVIARDGADLVTQQSWQVETRNRPTVVASDQLRDQGGTFQDGRYRLHVAATDGDSGVKSIEVLVDGARREYAEQPCPDEPGACSYERDFKFRTDDQDEGDHEIKVVVSDHAGHTADTSWTVNTRNRPTAELSGELTDDRPSYADGRYGLRVVAADGDSGVKSIELLVDGKRREYAEQPCADEPGACAFTKDFIFRTDDQDEGSREIRVLVTDQKGHTRSSSWTIDVRNRPTLALSGPLRDREGVLPDGTYTLHSEATDRDSGVKSIEVKVDGSRLSFADVGCRPGVCTYSHDVNFKNDDYAAEGHHTVSVTATDDKDHTFTESWVVDIRNKPDAKNFAPALGQYDRETVSNDGTYPVHWTQTDTGSGVASGRVQFNTATNGACDGAWTDIGEAGGDGDVVVPWNTTGLAEGLRCMRVVVTDRKGHSQSHEWQLRVVRALPQSASQPAPGWNDPDPGEVTPAAPSSHSSGGVARWYSGARYGYAAYGEYREGEWDPENPRGPELNSWNCAANCGDSFNWGLRALLRTPATKPKFEFGADGHDDDPHFSAARVIHGNSLEGAALGSIEVGLITEGWCGSRRWTDDTKKNLATGWNEGWRIYGTWIVPPYRRGKNPNAQIASRTVQRDCVDEATPEARDRFTVRTRFDYQPGGSTCPLRDDGEPNCVEGAMFWGMPSSSAYSSKGIQERVIYALKENFPDDEDPGRYYVKYENPSSENATGGVSGGTVASEVSKQGRAMPGMYAAIQWRRKKDGDEGKYAYWRKKYDKQYAEVDDPYRLRVSSKRLEAFCVYGPLSAMPGRCDANWWED